MPTPLQILVAPSAYKGTLTAAEVAKAIIAGLKTAYPKAKINCKLLADGGDSTIEAIHTALGGAMQWVEIIDPANERRTVSWLLLNDCAIIELAACCGLGLVKNDTRQPLQSNTYALGQVMQASLSSSCSKIIIGLGGSASTDGGTGALAALGIKFLDADRKMLPLGGGHLSNLAFIDISNLDKRIKQKKIELLTDVSSPLLGSEGAAFTFAPQKGASNEEAKMLEKGLTKLADISEELTGQDLRNMPRSGAAGGTAFGLASFLNALISPGFARIADITGIINDIKNSDLIITAEGRLDSQSLSGKATGELANLCQKFAKPLFVLPASAQQNINWEDFGFSGIYPTGEQNRLAEGKDITRVAANMKFCQNDK